MAEYKFKIGQFVYFLPQWPGHALPSRYQIVRRLRESGRVSLRDQEYIRRSRTCRERKRAEPGLGAQSLEVVEIKIAA